MYRKVLTLARLTLLLLLVCSLASCGGDDDGEDTPESPTYKTTCHRLIAECAPGSDCTAWAKALIDEGMTSYCSDVATNCCCECDYL